MPAANTYARSQKLKFAGLYAASPALQNLFLSQNFILLLGAAPTNAPLEGVRDGGVYPDRSDPKLCWFVPSFVVVADPDPRFAYVAKQTGHDAEGDPFFACTLTASVTTTLPVEVAAYANSHPEVQVRAIPVSGLTVQLETSYKALDGTDKVRVATGSIVDRGGSSYEVTFDNILGGSAIALYEDLRNSGSATLRIAGSYRTWRRVPRAEAAPAGPPRKRVPNTVAPRPSFVQTTSSLRSSRDFVLVERPVRGIPSTRPVLAESTGLQPVSESFSATVSIGKKYAADVYSLKFLVGDDSTQRPLISRDDLRNFDVRRSQFTALSALGDISERYPTLSRAYVGVLSKTVIVIPARYAITRNTAGLDCECLALVDSAATSGMRCKFEFRFMVAPDVSAIDLLQFSSEVAAQPALQGYRVTLPSLLDDKNPATLQTAFDSGFDVEQASVPHAFSLAVEVRDGGEDAPAVTRANMLIRNLCAGSAPYLVGALGLKLDDYFTQPVTAPIVLNFHESVLDPNELQFVIDEAAAQVTLENRSTLDLRLSRYALSTSSETTVIALDQVLLAGQGLKLPLPTEHANLNILVDRESALPETIEKQESLSLMSFQAQDAQTTQWLIGINASAVDFAGRGIAEIAASVSLRDLPQVSVPGFSLLALRKLNQTNVTIPLLYAVSRLLGTIQLTIRFVDPGRTPQVFTIDHEFLGSSVLILKDGDIPASPAPAA